MRANYERELAIARENVAALNEEVSSLTELSERLATEKRELQRSLDDRASVSQRDLDLLRKESAELKRRNESLSSMLESLQGSLNRQGTFVAHLRELYGTFGKNVKKLAEALYGELTVENLERRRDTYSAMVRRSIAGAQDGATPAHALSCLCDSHELQARRTSRCTVSSGTISCFSSRQTRWGGRWCGWIAKLLEWLTVWCTQRGDPIEVVRLDDAQIESSTVPMQHFVTVMTIVPEVLRLGVESRTMHACVLTRAGACSARK